MKRDLGTTKPEEALKMWIKVWEENGEPHPNSNKYIELTRTFFYSLGFENGLKTAMRMEKEDEVL